MEINIRFDADRRGNSDANSHRGGISFAERIRLTNMLPVKVIVAINSVGTRRNHVSLSRTFRNTFSSNVLLNTRNIDTVSLASLVSLQRIRRSYAFALDAPASFVYLRSSSRKVCSYVITRLRMFNNIYAFMRTITA